MSNGSRTTNGSDLPARAIRVMDVLLAAAGVAATAALVLDYGFRDGARPVPLAWLHAAEAAIVVLFVLDRGVRLLLARCKADYVRENGIELALIAVAAVIAAIGYGVEVLGAGTLYVVISQAYVLGKKITRGLHVDLGSPGSGLRLMGLLLGCFAFLCLAGWGLLSLPVATPPLTSGQGKELFPVDAIFTAVSATCATGLSVRDTGLQFTPFGQAVILGLVQLGGLGVMLFGTLLAAYVWKGLGIGSSRALGEMIGADSRVEIGRLVRFVAIWTVVAETAGAALMYPMFLGVPQAGGDPMTPGAAAWYSVFHSVSAFCNAGFSLYDKKGMMAGNLMAGVGEAGWARPLRDHWQVLGVMAPLIVLGGVGFPVLADGGGWVRRVIARLVRRPKGGLARGTAKEPAEWPRLCLHSRVVLWATVWLILIGALGLLLVEPGPRAESDSRHQIGKDASRRADWLDPNNTSRTPLALFQSISARSAGFNTVDLNELSDAGRLWLCGLMLVGGSPAGTAGGMKTVTLVLLLASAWGLLRRRREMEVLQRRLCARLLRKAAAVAVLYLSLVGAMTLALCVLMRDLHLMDLLFEACSACGSAGLSTGITPALSDPAKYAVIGGMFVGRLMVLAVLLALAGKARRAEESDSLENVFVG